MSEWGWVAFAYAVTYGSLAVFAGSIAVRIRNARRTLGENE
jgi:hypothetical protein